ncbi:MAG: class I SAM-dependent methyltransferase [Anaerolineae bacterium]
MRRFSNLRRKLTMTFWNHNSHFHDLILSQLPSKFDTALDVGSGSGDFATRLANQARHVDAVEIDPKAVSIAVGTCAPFENINLITSSFLDPSFAAGRYDVVTALAALHHMDLEQSLTQAKRILRPGGTLAILGLYRESNLIDHSFSIASVVAHRFLTWRNRNNLAPASNLDLQVQPPADTLPQIKALADRVIPGATVQRRLLWRYTLFWRKPESAG